MCVCVCACVCVCPCASVVCPVCHCGVLRLKHQAYRIDTRCKSSFLSPVDTCTHSPHRKRTQRHYTPRRTCRQCRPSRAGPLPAMHAPERKARRSSCRWHWRSSLRMGMGGRGMKGEEQKKRRRQAKQQRTEAKINSSSSGSGTERTHRRHCMSLPPMFQMLSKQSWLNASPNHQNVDTRTRTRCAMTCDDLLTVKRFVHSPKFVALHQ